MGPHSMTEDPIVEQIAYNGCAGSVSISNATVQLIVTTEVGPRILFYGMRGGENAFHEVAEDLGKRAGREFRLYGGHRLWVSPEVARTYYPDNFPVSVRRFNTHLVFTAPPESRPPGSNLQKEIEIELDGIGSHVRVTHRIRNLGKRGTRLAPWALSVMAGGGTAILPLPPRAPFSPNRLLPEGVIATWSYTDLADPRWKIGTGYIQLRQQSSPEGRFQQQMIGIHNPAGWCAYHRNGCLFVKKSRPVQGATYPDFGCNCEVFTGPEFLELETLGPLRILKPGGTAEHTEHWWLFENLESGEDEDWIERTVRPLVESAECVDESSPLRDA